VGTINWCAPEILFSGEPYTRAADVYSFGMVCYEIVSKGRIPYAQLNPLQTIRAIEEGEKPNLYAAWWT
jgi:serine/threonine protein kinase